MAPNAQIRKVRRTTTRTVTLRRRESAGPRGAESVARSDRGSLSLLERRMDRYRIERYGDIDVCWESELEGGGLSFGRTFVPVVRDLVGPVDRVFEFCAGPGFIGFSLLAEGLCRSLALADVNPDAVRCLQATVDRNRLHDRVSVYTADGLDGLPGSESWDLVVSNPPHHLANTEKQYRGDIRAYDPGWRIHAAFYSSVRPFLKRHGSILMLENYDGSNESTFLPHIRAGGLRMIDSFRYRGPDGDVGPIFFTWVKPAWPELHAEPEVNRLSLNASEIIRSPFGLRSADWRRVELTVRNDTQQEQVFELWGPRNSFQLSLTTMPGETKSAPIIMLQPGMLLVESASRSHRQVRCLL
jgi:hypothetical protein